MDETATVPPSSPYQRAVAFVTNLDGHLLVFDHVGDPSSGTQVPAGGISATETPESAVTRELAEESGLESAGVIRKLGEAWNRSRPEHVPVGYEEQLQQAFHLHIDGPVADSWEWDECDGGTVARHRFAFRWVTIEDARQLLWPAQAMWLSQLQLSSALQAEEQRCLTAGRQLIDEGRVTLRRSRPADEDWARQLHHDALCEVVTRQFGSWDEAAQDKFFSHEWRVGITEVVEFDGVACGYVDIEDRPHDVHIREIAIAPQFQSHGVGTALVALAVERAERRHVPVFLQTLHENRAARLYRRFGFIATAATETHTLFRRDR